MSSKQYLLQTLTLVSWPTHKRPKLGSLQYGHTSNIELQEGDMVVFRIAGARSGDSVTASRTGIVIDWPRSSTADAH